MTERTENMQRLEAILEPLRDGKVRNVTSVAREIIQAFPAILSASAMTCDEQFAEAQRLASDLGYMVVADPIHADGEIHEPDFVAQVQPSLRALGFHAVPLSFHCGEGKP